MSDFDGKIGVEFVMSHPMTTATGGMITATASGILSGFVTALPIIHQIVSIVGVTLGSIASAVGIFVQVRKELRSIKAERQRAMMRRSTDVYVHIQGEAKP